MQQENYGRKLELAMGQGACVIVENISENFDPAIVAIINKEIFEIQGDKYIKFNDN